MTRLTSSSAAAVRPPHERQAALVAQACEAMAASIAAGEAAPALAQLAAQAGLSPYHFHRVFKAQTGLTPKAYALALRGQRLREALGAGEAVSAAGYQAGYGAASRWAAESRRQLGMAPRDYRAGGRHARLKFALGQCSLGAILVAATEQGICAVLLGDAPEALVEELQQRFPRAELVGGDADFEQWVAQVVGFVEAPHTGWQLPLDVQGTAFQQRVWQALQRIPPGQTLSYTEVAARLGQPSATRAVASACAANPVAVAIPCHRVVRSDGGLAGYRWGVERKRSLLQRESEQAEQASQDGGRGA